MSVKKEGLQFALEQPEDSARYRSPQDIHENGYFSFCRTQERKDLEAKYDITQIHMDQHPIGAQEAQTNYNSHQHRGALPVNGLRGEPDDKSRATEAFRSMTLQQRIQESKTWSSWVEGLTAVI